MTALIIQWLWCVLETLQTKIEYSSFMENWGYGFLDVAFGLVSSRDIHSWLLVIRDFEDPSENSVFSNNLKHKLWKQGYSPMHQLRVHLTIFEPLKLGKQESQKKVAETVDLR